MKKLMLIGLMIMGVSTIGLGRESLVNNARFASIEKANELLSQEDNFTKSWSQFDIDSRMHKKGSTKKELFEFITKQTREWTKKDKKKILSIFKNIDKTIEKRGFKLAFPDEIFFIKTTANEEGGAYGYTRANYIVLKEGALSQPKASLKRLIVHELFHVLTRNNPEFRKEMYQIIGFNLMDNVEYPESLKNYRITNPDAPQTDSYISVKVDGQSKDCMMILYSDQDYDGGDFFKYLNIGFLSLTGNPIKSIEYEGEKPVIYSFKQVEGFFEQVGKNTEYIIHPEEVLADNFSFAILNKKKLPNQEIVDKIKMKLKK